MRMNLKLRVCADGSQMFKKKVFGFFLIGALITAIELVGSGSAQAEIRCKLDSEKQCWADASKSLDPRLDPLTNDYVKAMLASCGCEYFPDAPEVITPRPSGADLFGGDLSTAFVIPSTMLGD